MSETLQWAQSSSGSFEQSGAWLANGTSTTATPTATTPVQFATGSSTAYTVSGTGTAASLTSLDVVTLSGTVSAAGPLSVGGGTLTLGGTLSVGDVAIGPGTVMVGVPTSSSPASAALASTGTLHVGAGGAGTLVASGGGAFNAVFGAIRDETGIVDGSSVVTLTGEYGTWTNAAGLQIGGGSAGTVTLIFNDDGLSAGSITVGTGGLLELRGSSLATIPITLSNGTIRAEANHGIPSYIHDANVPGSLTLAAGTTDTLDGLDEDVSASPGAPYQNFSGLISGSGTLLASNVSLNNATNTYTGGTVIEGGLVVLADTGSIGTGPLSFAPSVSGGLEFGAAAGSDTVPVGSASAFVSAGGVALLLTLTTGSLTFEGGTAASTVQGGSGRVIASASTGGGVFYGGTAGNNQLAAGTGIATLVGAGAGDVLTAGPAGGDLLVAGAGAETLNGAGATTADTFFAGGGADLVQTGRAAETVTAGAGPLTVQGGGGADLVFGSPGALTFYGSAAASTVVGGSGGNAVFGGAGRLAFYGGQGGGVAYGGTAGGNLLYTGANSTTLAGGGSGDVLVSTGAGGNTLLAGPGNQTLTGAGSTGSDAYFGNSGNVVIAAGTGSDTVVVGSGATTVTAGATGATAIFAGSGLDTIVLGGSSDFVLCGQGHATTYGGSGADLYGFANGAGGTEVISGFRPGTDHIQLIGYTAGTAATGVAGQIDAGGNTTVTLTDNTRITLLGVASIGGAAFV